MPCLLRPAPKKQDSQKNIYCLTQFLNLQRGCQDFPNLKASENADGREKLSTGGAETPPNTDHGNQREILLPSNTSECPNWATVVKGHGPTPGNMPFGSGLWGLRGFLSFHVTNSMGLRSNGKSPEIKIL